MDGSFYFLWCRDRDQSKVFQQNFKKKQVSTTLVDSRAEKFYQFIDLILECNESLTDSDITNFNKGEHRNRKEIQEIFVEIQNLWKKG